MSIYSGFATRFQQEAYDQCIDSLLYVLQKRIIKFYQNEQADEQKFIGIVMKIHQQMKTMEKNKYLDPKSSQSVNELVKFITTYQDNIGNNTHRQSQGQKVVEPLPIIQSKASTPEVKEKKKGSPFWVEKPIREVISKVSVDQDVQTMGTINFQKKQISIEKQKPQLRKTTMNEGGVKGLKQRNPAKFHLKDYKIEQNETIDSKLPKKRSTSNYIPEYQNTKRSFYLNSNISEHESSASRKHKIKSNSKRLMNQGDHQSKQKQNEVSDIIKDYITKVKKNYLRGHLYRQGKQSQSRLHDF